MNDSDGVSTYRLGYDAGWNERGTKIKHVVAKVREKMHSLKALNHHKIEEESWRIDEVLALLDKIGK